MIGNCFYSYPRYLSLNKANLKEKTNQLMQRHYSKVLSCCLLYLLTFLQTPGGESIAVLELEGRGISSFKATERLLTEHILVKVIILTILNTEDYQAKAN